MSIFPF